MNNRSFIPVKRGCEIAAYPLPCEEAATYTEALSCTEAETEAADSQNCRLALAMAYVPMQRFRRLYAPEEALCKGTLFRELDKPFTGRCKGRCHDDA